MGLLPVVLFGQDKDRLPGEREARKQAQSVEKQIADFEKNQRRQTQGEQASPPLSFRNFVRGGVGTGNLIQVPYVTNVNVSAGYWGSTISPSRITWPKGSGVEYGHTMSFIYRLSPTSASSM